MSVCVSVIPICATTNACELVNSSSAYEYSLVSLKKNHSYKSNFHGLNAHHDCSLYYFLHLKNVRANLPPPRPIRVNELLNESSVSRMAHPP